MGKYYLSRCFILMLTGRQGLGSTDVIKIIYKSKAGLLGSHHCPPSVEMSQALFSFQTCM